MQIKNGFEQSVYAICLLSMLPAKSVLPGEAISNQIGASPTYFQKILRKLADSDLITSVPGKKGGFKLKKTPSEIRIYDIFLAIEGQQALYYSNNVLGEMIHKKDKEACVLSDLMERAETSWITVLKSETISSLFTELHKEKELQDWVNQNLVQ